MPAPADGSRAVEAVREEAAAWLARLRGPSSAEDHAAFETWYGAHPDHAAAYEAVLESWDIAGLAGATPAGQSRARLAPTLAQRRRYAVAAIAATVVIALLAFGAYGAGFIARDPARPVEFASRSGEIRTIELADGSRVTLDTASLLRAAFSADERHITLLRGRGRFAVAHGDTRPFVVAAGTELVIAHGTLFDVAIDGDQVTVSLLQGSVEVRVAASDHRHASGLSRTLTPGQRVVLHAGEMPPPPTRVSETETRWANRMLTFENAPLGEVIAEANRYGPSRIVLADPALARLRFTGTFKAAETEQLARMIAATFGLGVSHDGNATVVLAPLPVPERGTQKIPG